MRLLLNRQLALPAYDQCMKASHLFNLLDARGVISVSERQAYIGRVGHLPRAVVRHGSAKLRPASRMNRDERVVCRNRL